MSKMRPRRYILLRLLLAALIIMAATAGAVYYRAYRAMVAARQYVSDVSRLQIGISGGYEFAKIRDKYRGFAEIDPNCNDNDCIVVFRFSNGLPVGASFVRPAFLYSGLTLSNGSITSSIIDSGCYGRNGGSFVAHMWESLPNAAHDVPFRDGGTMSSDKVATISFNLTPAASPEQRARAYAFHEGFLGRFEACNDATDMH